MMLGIISEKTVSTKVLSEKSTNDESKSSLDKPSLAYEDDYEMEIVWKNVVIFALLHAAAIYGIFLPKQYSTIIWWWVVFWLQGWGITIGAHRLFSHHSFKANAKLRAFLIFGQTLAVQNSMYEWVRDHRVHHKYVDTNADPHSSARGFFFSHMGWLMCKKHPDVKKFGGRIDMSDLEADKMVMFQHKYYKSLAFLIGFVFPKWFCVAVLGESFKVAFFAFILEYMFSLHLVWLINSGAHLWGYRPFDKNASSTDSLIFGITGMGDGWHNYHHCFPWDYKSGELPIYSSNFSLCVIDFFAKIGWATDLKTASQEMINKRAERTGDGTHKPPNVGSHNNSVMVEKFSDHSRIFGWNDKEMTDEDKKIVKILHKYYD